MAIITKISSLDNGYLAGDLSVFPEAIDDKESLYEAKNNSESTLKQSLPYNGKFIVIEDSELFPDNGIIRIGDRLQNSNFELVYYSRKDGNILKDIIRGFKGSLQSNWNIGTKVSSGVMAEHHNSIKDAILNIEKKLGTKNFPESNSLNGQIKLLENKYLAPKALFRGYPRVSAPPVNVRFQNFSSGNAVRFLWDFGDGGTSLEKNPTHTYLSEGLFTVKLNTITSTGSQGVSTKIDYINVAVENTIPFFYAIPLNTIVAPATFQFMDQTNGDIVQRYWIFGDGQTLTVDDPNIHFTEHTYIDPGEYDPTLLIVFANQKLKRVFLSEKIIVE